MPTLSWLACSLLVLPAVLTGCASAAPVGAPRAATTARTSTAATSRPTPGAATTSRPLPELTLNSPSLLQGSRVVVTDSSVSFAVPERWEAYSLEVLNALAADPPERVSAAADLQGEDGADYVKFRVADHDAIAVGPGDRPYSVLVSNESLVNGKEAGLATIVKDAGGDVEVSTWASTLGPAKVVRFQLDGRQVVGVEAHVRHGNRVVVLVVTGVQQRQADSLMRRVLSSLKTV